jgi:integrase
MNGEQDGAVDAPAGDLLGTEPGLKAPRYRPSVPMTDPDELDADIDRFLADNRRAQSTLTKHPYRLSVFTNWCRKIGRSSELPYPPELVCEYIAALVDSKALPSGRPPSPSYFSRLLAAIRHEHTDNGFATPTMNPTVRAVRAGAKKRLAALHTPRQAPPLLPDDAVQIAEIEVESTLTDIRRRAAVLLAWDTQASAAQMMRLDRTTIRTSSEMITLQLPAILFGSHPAPPVDITLRCRRALDCGYACTLCALRELDQRLPDAAGPLFAFVFSPDGTVALPVDLTDLSARRVATRTLRMAVQRVVERCGGPVALGPGGRVEVKTDDPAERDQVKRRLGLMADPAAVQYVRDRAALLLAWHDALRNIEVRTMQRGQLERIRDGFAVSPGVRKTHQDGDSDRLSVTRARDERLCAVRALDDWLDIYDAAAAASGIGDEGYVFCPANKGRLRPERPMTYANHLTRIKMLGIRAGLDKSLSGHSPRRGFAHTAAAFNATDEQIRTTMGLQTPELVATYRSGPTLPSAAPLRRLLAGGGEPDAR